MQPSMASEALEVMVAAAVAVAVTVPVRKIDILGKVLEALEVLVQRVATDIKAV